MHHHRRVSPVAMEVANLFRGHCRHHLARQRLAMSLSSRLVAIATPDRLKRDNAQLRTRSTQTVLFMLVARPTTLLTWSLSDLGMISRSFCCAGDR